MHMRRPRVSNSLCTSLQAPLAFLSRAFHLSPSLSCFEQPTPMKNLTLAYPTMKFTEDQWQMAAGAWARDARLIGLSDIELMHWANCCIQILTGLFSYLNGIAIPWRVSILCHHLLSKRSSAPGHDFYGRPTEAIWFHIPQSSRIWIAAFLNLSVFFHFATQATRFVWTDYVTSNILPGIIPINVSRPVTALPSCVCARHCLSLTAAACLCLLFRSHSLARSSLRSLAV